MSTVKVLFDRVAGAFRSWLLVSLAAVFCCGYSAAQDGRWVPYQLPSYPGSSVEYAVGENCLIFVEDTSKIIQAFDIFSHQWHAYTAPTMLPWRPLAMSDGNTALVYNDSVAVAYSALTGTFTPVVLDSLPLFAAEYGCSYDMAYFVTAHTFYAFDGTDGSWHTHTYAPVTGASSASVRARQDYLLLTVVGPIGSGSNTYIVYSQVTKTFTELPGQDVNVNMLDGGLVFFLSGGQYTQLFIGGYSALTGTSVQIGSFPDEPTLWFNGNDPNLLSAVHSAMFQWNELLGGDAMRLHFYDFDTRQGSFTLSTVDWDYNHYPLSNIISCGNGFSVVGFRAHDNGDSTDLYMYRNSTGTSVSWREWFDWVPGYPIPSSYAGGEVFLAYGRTIMRWYDVEALRWSTATMPTLSYDPYPQFVSIRAGDTWGTVAVRPKNDSLCVYSYNAASNNLQSFVRVVHGADFDGAGRNVYTIVTIDNSKAALILFYSPSLDTWTEIDPGNQPYFGFMGLRDYAFASLLTSNSTIIFDGITGQQMTLPMCPSTMNVIYQDDSFLMWNSSGHFYGYSPFVHNWTEYQTTNSGVHGGAGATLVFSNGNWVLVYNGLRNSFVEKTLTQAEGTRESIATGRFTALFTTSTQYIFAFDPEATSNAVKLKVSGLAASYKLDQNYPNPFNPSTTIRYELPRKMNASLVVYNTLGQKVATLVQGEQDAGYHRVKFDGSGLASGVYFYRLQAGGFVQTKKLILAK